MTPLTYEAAFLVQSLCGALILILLYLSLRSKSVKDASLLWLFMSLLSWSARAVMEVAGSKWPMARLSFAQDQIKYLWSPISSVLFTLATFQLARVRDKFRHPDLKVWPKRIVGTVTAISAVAFASLLLGWVEFAKFTDATASTAALIVLCSGLMYSFLKYSNQFLTTLTGFTFLAFIARQFYVATHNELPQFAVAIFLATSTMLIMLFIALAVAWGLSDQSRLKPVGISENVDIVAMFFDLRGSTQWTEEVKDFHYVRTFIADLLDWSSREASVVFPRPNLVKFLGDGFMFVWEVSNDALKQSAKDAVGLAYNQFCNYPSWLAAKKELHVWGTPKAIGVGIDVGSAIRLTFENGSEDYIGRSVNIAAKMQNLARPFGGVVIQSKVWELLDDQDDRFPKQGEMRIGEQPIDLRMTKDVVLDNAARL